MELERPENLRAPLVAGTRALGLALTDAQHDALLDYLALLARWNATYNLTAIRDIDEMLAKHVLDSLAIAKHVREQRIADLGTGAGLPGIPLAIADPSLTVALVESNGKKARFLREAQRRLALANVEVREARAESGRPGQVDAVVARALAALPDLAALAAHWLSPGGTLYAMKGPGHEDELRTLGPGWAPAATERLAVPGLDADRYLVVLKRSV
ncbi:MAG TPA: 16S rRNA (guanine(527)-N(7))-methyltransferase RsmG [Xanthomonadales bacterium]|nr:16S rRNA (guanine(527)-N(7))-methyltransferase RsmG [Xanthomonadales bacterium]